MNRRTVLLGLGTTGLATGAIFGSGAFTSLEAERDFTIDVTGDGAAVVQLDPNENLDGISLVGEDADDEQLAVDLDNINVESTLNLGDPDDPDEDEAFVLTNDTGGADFTEGFPLEISASTDIEADIEFVYEDDDTIQNLFEEGVVLDDQESVNVAITADLETDDIDGTVTLEAERTTIENGG
ncbi:hypothetical protein ACLI4Z_03850 [Natrialbaceae archaeon A-arb3/5]